MDGVAVAGDDIDSWFQGVPVGRNHEDGPGRLPGHHHLPPGQEEFPGRFSLVEHQRRRPMGHEVCVHGLVLRGMGV